MSPRFRRRLLVLALGIAAAVGGVALALRRPAPTPSRPPQTKAPARAIPSAANPPVGIRRAEALGSPEWKPLTRGVVVDRALFREVVDDIERNADFSSALRAVEQAAASDDERDALELEITRKLAALNPDWAATFAFLLPRGAVQSLAVDRAAEAIAQRDPLDALRWAQCLPVGFPRSVAVERIVGHLADSDLTAAVTAVGALPSSLVQDDAWCSLAAHWARRDAAGAVEWLARFPESPLKARVIATIGFELAQSDPAAAARLANTLKPAADRALFRASIRWTRAGTSPATSDGELP